LYEKIGYFRPIRRNLSHLLDPEYDKYADLEQYILASARKTIDLGLSKGFTCYGTKTKAF